MAIIDELNEGSFRGAKFLVQSATTSGGRKQVKHEYPNSDKQSIEDLGFMPRNFKLTAIISGPSANDPRSFFQKRDDLLKALETPGNGTLSHPWFSSSFEVTARPWTLDDNMTSVGKSSITLEFDYNVDDTNPQPIVNTLSSINKKITGFVDSLKESFVSEFNAISPVSYESALNAMNQFTDFTQLATTTFAQLPASVSPFNSLISTFRLDMTSLIPVPQNLADSFFQVMNNVQGLFDAPGTLIDVYSRFFGFGDDFTYRNETTVPRIENNNNLVQIRNAVQSNFLAFSYQAAAENTYLTVNEIDTVQETLEAQFQKLRGYDLSATDLNLLTDLRTTAVKYLEAEKLKAADIVNFDIKSSSDGLPMAIIAYALYAESTQDDFDTKFQTLIDLNRPSANNLSSVKGTIDVVTQ